MKNKFLISAILCCSLVLSVGGYLGCQPAPQPQPPPFQELFGWEPSPEGVQDFLDSLPHPEFQGAAPDLRSSKEPVFLWRALPKTYVIEKQVIGDCVSWGHKHAVDVLGAIDFKTGQADRFIECSSESIYGGSRVEGRGRPEGSGGYQDGSYGAAACKWLLNYGVIYRDVYQTPNGELDLRKYDTTGERPKQWGNWGNGGKGDKGFLDNIARSHPVKSATRVTTWDELCKAQANGYPVSICSNFGFNYETDRNGFCFRGPKPWSHCMCIWGIRYDIEAAFIINSWGPKYIDYSKGVWPEDMPRGGFWAQRKDIETILSAGDSWALSGVKGFPARKIHIGW